MLVVAAFTLLQGCQLYIDKNYSPSGKIISPPSLLMSQEDTFIAIAIPVDFIWKTPLSSDLYSHSSLREKVSRHKRKLLEVLAVALSYG